MEHLNIFPNWHIAFIFEWSITAAESFSHPFLPVANCDRKKRIQPFHFFSLNDYWTPETRWSVCECHRRPVVTFDNFGLSGKYQYNFCHLQEGATGEKIAFGLISSLIRCTANISDKDIWWREVHNSRLPSLLPEMFSLYSFRQHAHLDKLRMRCLHAGRQAGTNTHTNCLSLTLRKVIYLWKHKHPPSWNSPKRIFFSKYHNVSKRNSLTILC